MAIFLFCSFQYNQQGRMPKILKDWGRYDVVDVLVGTAMDQVSCYDKVEVVSGEYFS